MKNACKLAITLGRQRAIEHGTVDERDAGLQAFLDHGDGLLIRRCLGTLVESREAVLMNEFKRGGTGQRICVSLVFVRHRNALIQ